MDIAKALRQASKAAGWSPTKLAAEADVTEFAAKKWLDGRATPRAVYLEKLRFRLPGLGRILDKQVQADLEGCEAPRHAA